LTQSLGLPLSEVSKVHNVITSKFGVEKLVNRLRSEFLDKKCIRNKYGRRIAVPDSSDGTLLNSYLQSTGVDVALWGFLEIVNRLNDEWAVPVAVLHDALILDVTKEFAQKIGESLAVQVPGYIGKFPLKISIFNS
jgi:DNA polymerase I-like protein with 3'-5' exonuclease and polymerase domains